MPPLARVDAERHLPFSITQVSLLPPPWLELTTSDPLTSAVRVNPARQNPR